MLRIRNEQMEAFEQVALKRFEDYMVAHVGEHFPKHAELLGDEAMRKVIRHGYERAKGYGFTTQHEVCLFIDLMIMLGSGFDTDPQLSWARESLEDDSAYDATEQIDGLYDAAMEYLDRVVGKDQVFPVGPLRSILTYPVDELEQRLAGRLEQGTLVEFREIWPQKYRHVGDNQLNLLIREGIESAGKHGFTSNRSVGFYLILMFLLGHRFDDDPQYPWLSDVLNDEGLMDQTQKLDRLHFTCRTVLAKALE